MSLIIKLMIAGWATTLAMIGIFALNESGKLLNLRTRMASWVGSSYTTEKRGYPDKVQAD